MSNSPKVKDAVREVLEEFENMSPEEFKRAIENHELEKSVERQFLMLDTVAMLRES